MNKTTRLIIIFIALGLILICGLSAVTIRISAQSEDKAAAALPAEARQFDFWLGDWNGTIAGSVSAPNSITTFGLGGGIAILESFNGGSGTSVSVYSVKEKKWYQTWFDTDQLLIEVIGEFQNGRMVLNGQETRPTGAKFVSRETWFNISDNRYDFAYDVSPDGGQTFQTAFSAQFTRNTASSSAPEGSTVDSKNLAPSALPSKFRQFDFMRGEWEVTAQDCPSGASSKVALFGQGGGIAVLEDFRCGDSYRGTSVSVYNTQTGKWHYTWLDTDGLLLDMRGDRVDDDMVFEGEFNDPVSGQVRLARVTYDRISGSEIGRKFEVSENGGQTWAIRRTDHYAKATVFQPEGFRAKKVKSSKVKLGWTDTSPGENRFEVLRWDGGQWIVAKTYGANTTSATIKKLQSGTEYKFAVRACDGNRCSGQAEITVTTR